MPQAKGKKGNSTGKKAPEKKKTSSAARSDTASDAPSGKKQESEMLAAILVRSIINLGPDTRATLKSLNLGKKHACVVVKDDKSHRGMLKKVKDYVTWGEVSKDVANELDSKRGSGKEGFYRLHPPRGGFERKGVKKSFQRGGALGYRASKINELIRKMI